MWCLSPCVIRGTLPSQCLLLACSIAPSAGKNLLHSPHPIQCCVLSWTSYIVITLTSYVWLRCFCVSSVVWFAPGWKGLLQWKWDFWNPGREIQSQRMRFYEDFFAHLLIPQFKSWRWCSQFQHLDDWRQNKMLMWFLDTSAEIYCSKN